MTPKLVAIDDVWVVVLKIQSLVEKHSEVISGASQQEPPKAIQLAVNRAVTHLFKQLRVALEQPSFLSLMAFDELLKILRDLEKHPGYMREHIRKQVALDLIRTTFDLDANRKLRKLRKIARTQIEKLDFQTLLAPDRHQVETRLKNMAFWRSILTDAERMVELRGGAINPLRDSGPTFAPTNTSDFNTMARRYKIPGIYPDIYRSR